MQGQRIDKKRPGFTFHHTNGCLFSSWAFCSYFRCPTWFLDKKKVKLEKIFCKRHLSAVVCTKRKVHICFLCHSIFLCFDAGHASGVPYNRQCGNFSDLQEDFCAWIYFLKNSSCVSHNWNVHCLWKKQRSSEVHIKSSHVLVWNVASYDLQILFNDGLVSHYFKHNSVNPGCLGDNI